MLPTRQIICALLLQVIAWHAHAADAAGNYAIWGVGGSSCHQFLKSANDESRNRYRVFVMGYLTAFNTLTAETYSATGAQTLEVSIDAIEAYCIVHQMDSFDRAIQQLLTSLYASRAQEPPNGERAWGRAAKAAPSATTAKEP